MQTKVFMKLIWAKPFWFTLFLLLGVGINIQAQTSISSSGFTFSPNLVTVNRGQTVTFNIGGSHNAIQVSKSTWEANGSTALSGGVSIPFGGGSFTVNVPGSGADTLYFVCSPHAGLGMKCRVAVNAVLSTPQKLMGQLNIYPVPANDFITVTLPSDLAIGGTIRIVNLLGQVVKSVKTTELTHQISLMGIPTGQYFIALSAGDTELRKKIVVTH